MLGRIQHDLQRDTVTENSIAPALEWQCAFAV